MSVRIFTSQELMQDGASVLKAAMDAPVYITDDGQSAYVLLRADEYHLLTGKSIVDMLSTHDDVDFAPSRADVFIRPANL